jgi:hypothetical protein
MPPSPEENGLFQGDSHVSPTALPEESKPPKMSVIFGLNVGECYANYDQERHYLKTFQDFLIPMEDGFSTLPSVRDPGEDYRYEMSEADHIELAGKLNQTKGAVLVSGYHSDLYDDLYKGWIRREKRTRANMHGERTEVLWMKGVDLGLFGGDL